MKDYWDLTEKERAGLTRDGVAEFIGFELMRKGVLRPAALELETDPVDVAIEKEVAFVVTYQGEHNRETLDLVWNTREAAEKFIEVTPPRVMLDKSIGHDWRARRDYKIARPLLDPRVESRDIAKESAVDENRAALEDAQNIRARNKERNEEHKKALREQEDALEAMWSDWESCCASARRHRRVFEVFREYVETAGGDEKVAAKFLRKVYRKDQIEDANEWVGPDAQIGQIPIVEVDEKDTREGLDAAKAGEGAARPAF